MLIETTAKKLLLGYHDPRMERKKSLDSLFLPTQF